MAFLDYSHVELTPEFIKHVLHGEDHDSERGGHLYGMGRENKTEFPPDWTPDRIVRALELVLAKPQQVSIAPPRILLSRIVAGIAIQLELRTLGNEIIAFSAFPVGGPGVIRNVRGKKYQVPYYSYEEGI